MTHDIFVSYAHADDEPPGAAKYGGVTTFVEELKKVLRKKMGGSGAQVWMDHHLAANQRVTETLQEHVLNSRIILLFMSPGYLKSQWCASELGQFLASNQARFHRENVFVVAIEDTPRVHWPERVQALTPIELFERDIRGVTKTLGWPYPPLDPDSKYWTRLNELAHLIRDQLALLFQDGAAAASVVVPRGGASPNMARTLVWIAQGTADVQDEWESLASAVRQTGAQVLPRGARAYPESDGAAFKAAAVNDLMQADLIVQLYGADAGPELGDAGGARLVPFQHEMAHLLKGELAPRFMRWRKSGTTADGVESDAQDAYQRLLRGAVTGPIEQFRSLVVREVQRLAEPVPLPGRRSREPGDALTICVTGALPDEGLAQNVCAVVNNLGAVPISAKARPDHGQSQTEYREQFEDLLSNVDGVILVHGAAPSMWLQSRYAQVRKVLGQRPTDIWGAFLDGPPPDKAEPVIVEGPGLLTLSCRHGRFESPIEEFLTQLRRGRGHV